MCNMKIGEGTAIINKVQTLPDGGSRITLDLGADSTDVALKLMAIKMIEDQLIKVVFERETHGTLG